MHPDELIGAVQVLHDGSHFKHPTGVAISDGRQGCVQAVGEKPDIHA